jgi:hypothetical protein
MFHRKNVVGRGKKIQNEREVIEPKTIVFSKGCWKKKN